MPTIWDYLFGPSIQNRIQQQNALRNNLGGGNTIATDKFIPQTDASAYGENDPINSVNQSALDFGNIQDNPPAPMLLPDIKDEPPASLSTLGLLGSLIGRNQQQNLLPTPVETPTPVDSPTLKSLTQEQKDAIIRNRGLNPSNYIIDDEGYVTEKPTSSQPSVSSAPTVPNVRNDLTTTPSVTSAFVKSAAQEAPSAIASGLGAAVGAQLLPFAHAFPPFSEIGAGLIGAGVSAMGTKALQQEIEPESWTNAVEQARQAHPIAGALGELSTIPLSGLNPSPTTLGKGLGGAVKMLPGIGMSPTAEELAALTTTGVGAGLQPIQSIAQSLISGQPIPGMGDLAKQAAIGALFSKPNAIGKAMGFHGLDTIPKSEPSAEDLSQNTGVPVQAPKGPLKMVSKPTIVEQPTVKEPVIAKTAPTTEELQPKPIKQPPPPVETATPEEADILEDKQIQREMRKASQYNKFFSEESQLPGGEKSKDLGDLLGELTFGPKKNIAEYQRLMRLQDKAMSAAERADYTNHPANDAIQKLLEIKPKNIAEFEAKLNSIINTYQGFQQFQPSPKAQTAFSKEVVAQIKEQNLPTKPESGWFAFFKRLGGLRNYVMQEDRTIKDAQNRTVAGQAIVEKGLKGLIKLNPDIMGADVPGHEAGHIFARTLENSPRARDQEFYSDYQKKIEQLPDYQTWKEQRDAAQQSSTPEEYIMTNQGIESWRRAVSTEKPFQKYWNDLTSYLKTRYGKHATESDYRRIFNYKLLHDPSFDRLFGKNVPANVGQSSVNASKESDLNLDNHTEE